MRWPLGRVTIVIESSVTDGTVKEQGGGKRRAGKQNF